MINAIPPLSTIVIDDDDISSSAISELDSNQFTHFSGDNDILSDSILNTLQPPRKRRKLATSTWQLTRDPLPHKAIRDGKN